MVIRNLSKLVPVGLQDEEQAIYDNEQNPDENKTAQLNALQALFNAPSNELLGLPNAPSNYVENAPTNPIELPKSDYVQQENAQPELPKLAGIKQKANKLAELRSRKSEPASEEAPVQKNVDLADKELEDAQSQSNQNRMLALLTKIGQNIGTSIANKDATIGKGIDSDNEVIDELVKSAGSPVEQLKTKRDQYQKMLENRKLQMEQDPNSQDSIAARDLYRSMGGKVDDTASASDLEGSLKYLQQKYSMDEARRNRAEAAKERAIMQGDRETAKKLSLMKAWEDKIVGNEDFKMYSSLSASENAIDQYIADPQAAKNNPYAAFQTIMGTLKPLQGDMSVMRESDLAVFMKKFGTFNNAEEAMKNFGGETKITDPKFLALAKKAIKVAKISREKNLKPFAQQVSKLGDIDPSLKDYMNDTILNIAKSGSLTSEQSSGKLSDQDKAAIEWAKANPNDDRAKKILQMHGVK